MSEDTCRPVEVDGEIIRVHGGTEMDATDREHFAEIVRAAKHRLASERCELSDLPVDQCACRNHATPEPVQPFVVVAKFPARFDSNCENCGNRMHEGDPIARTEDGDYICEACS